MGKRGRKLNKGKTSEVSSVEPIAETETQNVKEKMSGQDKITDYFPTSPKSPPSQSQVQKEAPIHIPGLLTPDTTPTKKATVNDAQKADETSPATTTSSKTTEQPETLKKTESPTESPEHKRSLSNNICSAEKASEKDSDKDAVSEEGRTEEKKEVKGREKGQKLDQEGEGRTEEKKGVKGQKVDQEGTSKGKASKSKGSGKPRKSRSSKQPTVQTNTLTDYFPVRRSSRRCKSDIEAEQKKEIEEAVLTVREDGLEVRDILGKGRGVLSTKSFRQGDFVVEYYGDLIDVKEAKEREAEYGRDPSVGCYMYYFQYKTKQYCVDATGESGRLGRLLNHSKNGNCCTKLVEVKGQPHLIIVAAKDIAEGEELLYDYGDRDKETLAAHPWLAL